MRSSSVRRLTIAALAVATVISGAVLATAEEGAEPVAATVEESDARASSGDTDMVAHGTAWVAERRGKFKMFKPFGWGTKMKIKVGPSNEWVHIPIPYMSRIENDRTWVEYVEFCGRSSNGALTKPIRLDVWNNRSRIASVTISWAANNNVQCHGISFSPKVMAQSLGLSVLLHFDSTTDNITLYKGWVRAES